MPHLFLDYKVWTALENRTLKTKREQLKVWFCGIGCCTSTRRRWSCSGSESARRTGLASVLPRLERSRIRWRWFAISANRALAGSRAGRRCTGRPERHPLRGGLSGWRRSTAKLRQRLHRGAQQAVRLRKLCHLGAARHAAIGIHQLAQHASGRQTCQLGQIH